MWVWVSRWMCGWIIGIAESVLLSESVRARTTVCVCMCHWCRFSMYLRLSEHTEVRAWVCMEGCVGTQRFALAHTRMYVCMYVCVCVSLLPFQYVFEVVWTHRGACVSVYGGLCWHTEVCAHAHSYVCVWVGGWVGGCVFFEVRVCFEGFVCVCLCMRGECVVCMTQPFFMP